MICVPVNGYISKFLYDDLKTSFQSTILVMFYLVKWSVNQSMVLLWSLLLITLGLRGFWLNLDSECCLDNHVCFLLLRGPEPLFLKHELSKTFNMSFEVWALRKGDRWQVTLCGLTRFLHLSTEITCHFSPTTLHLAQSHF